MTNNGYSPYQRSHLMKNTIVGCATALALGMGFGCSQQAQEAELTPESREGVFLLSFAEARAAAQTENKMILVDMWRPG
jgi:hypothetical protein